MTVSPEKYAEGSETFKVRVNLRRTYAKNATYKEYLSGNMTEAEKKKLLRTDKEELEYYKLLAKQEIELRKHNAKRAAMEKFDRQYSAYVILCNYLSSTGQTDKAFTNDELIRLTTKEPTKIGGKIVNICPFIHFGQTYLALNPKNKKKDATILKKVAQKLEMKVDKELKINSKETMLKHVKWAYRTYKGMTDDRKDKKNISCLKSYYGKCECVNKGLK